MAWTLLGMLLWKPLAGIVLGALAWTVRRRGLPALLEPLKSHDPRLVRRATGIFSN